MANWNIRIWTLAVADLPGGPTIMGLNRTNKFWLEPMLLNGQLLAYRVQFNAQDMTPTWRNVILFPRGTAAPQMPQGQVQGPLPPYNGQAAGDYTWVATEVARTAKPITERLEGDMIVNGNAEALTLYQVPNGIQGGGELLIVTIRESATGQGASQQDGNGAGF